eukprot:3796163-Prymnesium_polylepis.1
MGVERCIGLACVEQCYRACNSIRFNVFWATFTRRTVSRRLRRLRVRYVGYTGCTGQRSTLRCSSSPMRTMHTKFEHELTSLRDATRAPAVTVRSIAPPSASGPLFRALPPDHRPPLPSRFISPFCAGMSIERVGPARAVGRPPRPS